MAERTGPIAAVLLAAGSSARMGTNKLLLPLGGEACSGAPCDAPARPASTPSWSCSVTTPGASPGSWPASRAAPC